MCLKLKMTYTKLNYLVFSLLICILGDFGTFLNVNVHNDSCYQISVRSWQIWYHIKALNRESSYMCILGIFSGGHGNESQKLI